MSDLDISYNRWREIMDGRTTHKHLWNFGYPILGHRISAVAYYCDCGDSHAIFENKEMTIEEAEHEVAFDDNLVSDAEWIR